MSLFLSSPSWWEMGRVGWLLLAAVACAAVGGWWGAVFAGRYACLIAPAAWRVAAGAAHCNGMPPDLALRRALRTPTARRRRPSVRASRQLRWFMALVSAAAAFPLFAQHGLALAYAASSAAVVVLLVLAVVDAQTGLLPDVLTFPLLWAGLALAWVGGGVALHASVGAAMLGYVGLYALFLVFRAVRRRDGMGHGDFKLAAAIGAWVGPLPLLYVLLAASLLGLVYAFWRGKGRGLSATYPFGPFLAAAAIAALALGPGLHSSF